MFLRLSKDIFMQRCNMHAYTGLKGCMLKPCVQTRVYAVHILPSDAFALAKGLGARQRKSAAHRPDTELHRQHNNSKCAEQ